jgi:hypothetical protein
MPANSNKMIVWRYRTYFSVAEDMEVSRVSGFDERNQEHWMVIEAGKGARERREDAVRCIMSHIERGEPAGEVEQTDVDIEAET